ncbi:hypothetical protein CR513_02536, partial [Mucuna pruriens]
MRVNTQSVNARIHSLSKWKKKEVQKSRRESENSHDGGYESDHSHQDPIRGKRYGDMISLGMNQNEIPWILSKVKLITLYFEGYALIWWNEITIQIKGMRIDLIESWDELKIEMREISVPFFLHKRPFCKITKNVSRSKKFGRMF